MQNELLTQAEQLKIKRKRHKLWQKLVCALACVVVFCTTYALILPAITMEQTAYCGVEEHRHGAECYEKRLSCGYDESAADCHVHDDSCYEERQVLICGMTEEDGGHTHGPECYETTSVLVCGLSEEEKAEGAHVHTDACYEEVLTCGLEEHEHSLACFSDSDADLESEPAWERSVSEVELTGVWADDVIAVAESQLGYRESSANYLVAENGDIKGITRYGQWYGDPYGDWCAMFVSFCLHYAELPESAIPYDAGCPHWVQTLSEPEWALYREAGAYTPVKGDLLFLDSDEDGCADHVGLIAEIDDKTSTLRTIEGNYDDQVAQNEYSADAAEIMGYGSVSDAFSRVEYPAGAAVTTQSAADALIARVDALPALDEIRQTLAAFEEEKDEAGYAACLDALLPQISDALDTYNALTAAQRSAVSNADKLQALARYFGLSGNGGSQRSVGVESLAAPSGGFAGYVQEISISSLVDGTTPWDIAEGDGNDTGDKNRIVRTFDTVKYTVTATFASRDSVSVAKSAEVCFELCMDAGLTEAVFDTSTMSWLLTGNVDWKIEYLDASGTVTLIQNSSGLYFANADGTLGAKTSVNAIVNGSETDDPYRLTGNPIMRQRLCGTLVLKNEDNVFAATQDFTAGIYVQNAANGSTISPTFRIYFVNNPENYGVIKNGSSYRAGGNAITLDNTYQSGKYAVTVTCAPLFNMTLRETNEYVNYLSWFDFSADDEVTDTNVLTYLNAAGQLIENYDKVDPSEYVQSGTLVRGDTTVTADYSALYNALTEEQISNLTNIRYGRMNGLGITSSLAASAKEGKGYKGCSLPVGDITFDLSLDVETKVTGGTVDTSGYSAILWDYRPNTNFSDRVVYEDSDHIRQWEDLAHGSMARNLLWRGIQYSTSASRTAPTAYRGPGTSNDGVYDSGFWTLTDIGGSERSKSTASDANSVYTFTLSAYDFDLSAYFFPDRKQGEPAGDGKLRITDFAFFGGYAEVLYVMPYAIGGTVDVGRSITLGNLELTDLSGQKLELAEGAARGESVKADNEVNAEDNRVTSAITQYSAGSFTKRSSFNKADAYNHTNSISGGGSFLGTNFWGSPQWDENTYAGSSIAIMGSAQLTANSDNNVRAVNLLQLFDSKALYITPKSTAGDSGCITQSDVDFAQFYENTTPGLHDPTLTCLFAADPDRPDGYDTNADGVVSYMNTVRENDLVYADRLYWNEADQCYNLVKYDINGDGSPESLVCVGVLGEVRNCCYIDYCYIRVPITVRDDAQFVGETVCTVNAATVWIRAGAMADISWLNGRWSAQTGKNVLDGYVEIQSSSGTGGNGYTCFNSADGFTKIEYNETGGYQTGTAGKRDGASLLILGYKAKIHITNDKFERTGYNHYDLSGSERVVTWIIDGIRTEVDPAQPVKETARTTLTIPVELAYRGSSTAGQQALYSIAAGSYTITTEIYQTDSDGKPVIGSDGAPVSTGETRTCTVSDDAGSPTEITFLGSYTDSEGITRPTLYTYSIYAEPETDGTGVTFRLADVPVGQALPEIRFDMYLGNALLDNDPIDATASISGAGDRRAYSKETGNSSLDTIYIAKMSGSFLSKAVDKAYGEIGSEITYAVTYTNSSDSSVALSYFYDVLPYPQDERGSQFDGTRTITEISFASKQTGTDTDTGDFQAALTVYCSTKDSGYLSNLLTGFNGTASTTDPPNKDAVEAMLRGGDFQMLGKYVNGQWETPPTYPESVNAIFVKVEHMGPSRDLVATMTMQTSDNSAGSVYDNDAWHWNAGSAAAPLRSNIVQTRILARDISGVVWLDENLNGVRDAGETLLENVTCTLFRWNGAQNRYEQCRTDITGAAITPVITGTNGAYSFTRLAAGDYIVAFSGEGLRDCGGATVYQVNRKNDYNSNDGVALIATPESNLDKEGLSVSGIDGNTYSYAIAYTLTGTADVGCMSLHTIDDLVNKNIPLTNSMERYLHQDLGLVSFAGYELPKTGGAGTETYMAGGLSLILGAGALLLYKKHKKRGKEGFSSS